MRQLFTNGHPLIGVYLVGQGAHFQPTSWA
jgi:hypothetical protein